MHRTLSAAGIVLVLFAGTVAAAANQSHTHQAPVRTNPNDPCATMPSRWQRAQCYDFHRSAPGDEYFGRMKMSYLGIDNTAHDVAIEAGAYTTDPRLIAKIAFADEALHQWESRYPGDPQLARSYFLMIEVLRKIYTLDAQQRAWSYMQHVIHVYPTSYFAKVLRTDIALGFTEHWFATPEICPTPLPTRPPDWRGRWTPPTPEPTPIPTPTEEPTPIPPGMPKVVILTPPCVPPETPQPEMTEAPLPEESPIPESSPVPLPS